MKVFDERTVQRFALVPTFLDDGNTVWLEYYNVLQYFGLPNNVGHPRLSKNKWVDKKTFRKTITN